MKTRLILPLTLSFAFLLACDRKAPPAQGPQQQDALAPVAESDQARAMGDDPGAAVASNGERTSAIVLPEGEVKVTVLEHGSFVLKADQLGAIVIDPVTSALAYPEAEQAEDARLILVTDLHPDHMDFEAIARLRHEETVVIAPQAVVDRSEGALSGARVMENDDVLEVLDDQLLVRATPMYNIKRSPQGSDEPYHVKGRGNGYVLELLGGKIYISGDTECTPEMRALKAIDAAFVTMNLPYTMTVEEAAECIKAFKPGVVYPFHYRGQDPSKLLSLIGPQDNVAVRVLEWYPEAASSQDERPSQ